MVADEKLLPSIGKNLYYYEWVRKCLQDTSIHTRSGLFRCFPTRILWLSHFLHVCPFYPP